MRVIPIVALLLLGGGMLLPRAEIAVVRAQAPDNAVCLCRQRSMPAWAAWYPTHDTWLCTVVLPRDQSVPAQPCTLVNTQPPAPAGFDVRVTP